MQLPEHVNDVGVPWNLLYNPGSVILDFLQTINCWVIPWRWKKFVTRCWVIFFGFNVGTVTPDSYCSKIKEKWRSTKSSCIMIFCTYWSIFSRSLNWTRYNKQQNFSNGAAHNISLAWANHILKCFSNIVALLLISSKYEII